MAGLLLMELIISWKAIWDNYTPLISPSLGIHFNVKADLRGKEAVFGLAWSSDINLSRIS
uniref:Uncharacterized protein n=1 Tax=Anguilla anguilla TaxID=7936 RepID=A0A0E9R2H6_ANGAN